MRRNRALLLNTLLLTATSLFMRAVGLAFQVYLSKTIGAVGIGLFTLVMSVNSFAATFAISGIRFTSMRLTAEELGRNNSAGIRKTITCCVIYAVFFGTIALLTLNNAAGFIGSRIIGDERTVLSLKLLSLSLPLVAVASVFSGYFTAVCRVAKTAAVQIIEQLTRIAVIVVLLAVTGADNVELSCAVVVLGGVAGDMASFLLLFIIYKLDSRRYRGGKAVKTGSIPKRIVGIAMPLAVSAYARTALSTVQNLLVPRGFRKSGASAEGALSAYGLIQGMVFPVITFPAAFFSSLSELLIPEVTQAQVTGDDEKIENLSSRILKYCLIFSVGVMGMLVCFGENISQVIYSNSEAGKYICILAALMPIMYIDTVTDGILKGLGEQLYSMKINVLDSMISVAMVYLLLPKYAVNGYIFIMYFTEAFNLAMSAYRLSKKARITIRIADCIKILAAAFGAGNISVCVMNVLGLLDRATPFNIVTGAVVMAAAYYYMLVLFGCLSKSDKKWIKELIM